MKKLLCCLIALLLLPSAVLAESDAVTISFGVCTMNVGSQDTVYSYELQPYELACAVFPDMPSVNSIRPCIQVYWSPDDPRSGGLTTPEALTEEYLGGLLQTFEAAWGMTLSGVVYLCEPAMYTESGMTSVDTFTRADFSSASGGDAALSVYSELWLAITPYDGTYMFATSAGDEAGMDALEQYLLTSVLRLSDGPAAEAARQTFGDITLPVSDSDLVQQYDKSDGSMLVAISPDYSEASSFHPNMNVIWLSDDGSILLQSDVEAYARQIVQSNQASFNDQGITAKNASLIAVERMDQRFSGSYSGLSMIYSMDVDYSPLGYQLQGTLYQEQIYVFLGSRGTYILTLTAMSEADLSSLRNCAYALEVVEP